MTDKALVHHLSAPRAKGRPRVSTVIVVTLGVAFAVVMLSPFLLVAMNSFKSNADYSANGPLALPKALDLSAFERFLTLIDFPTALWNSVLVSGLVTLGGLLISVLAAYAIGIGRIKARTWVVAVLLIATMVPQEALVYPLFYGAQATSTLNTVWSVIVIFIVIQGAYGTHLLAGVIGTYATGLIEAEGVNGAWAWRIWSKPDLPGLALLTRCLCASPLAALMRSEAGEGARSARCCSVVWAACFGARASRREPSAGVSSRASKVASSDGPGCGGAAGRAARLAPAWPKPAGPCVSPDPRLPNTRVSPYRLNSFERNEVLPAAAAGLAEGAGKAGRSRLARIEAR